MSKEASNRLYRSPLKWAGGKRRIVHRIAKLLPHNKTSHLIEPFVGGGSVFLNLNFDSYTLVDSNPDLISLFNAIKNKPEDLICEANALFTPLNNQPENYYQIRELFNQTNDSLKRSAMFIYLNRHGYNGLCRYNKSGGYNVPFGRYKRPYFPLDEIRSFAQRSKYASFQQGDFSLAFAKAQKGDVIYCDPPYSPINKTASFTAYSGTNFDVDDHKRLVNLAMQAKQAGITTIISNHCLPDTLPFYLDANKIIKFDVARTISCNGKIRNSCKELMAVYSAE